MAKNREIRRDCEGDLSVRVVIHKARHYNEKDRTQQLHWARPFVSH